MLNGQKEPRNVVDTRGRVVGTYDRNPCYCERCQMQKVQKMGRWCDDCYYTLLADSRVDWSELTNAQFNHYAREPRKNAPAR